MYRLLAPALLLAFTTALLADELRGKVVSIADGDTITVLDENKKQKKVRLNGIDAPEKKQAFGAKSKSRLGDLVAGKDVVVEWKEKDKYWRIVGQVHQGPLDVNLQMVKEGLAWRYKKYSKSGESSSFWMVFQWLGWWVFLRVFFWPIFWEHTCPWRFGWLASWGTVHSTI